MVSGSILNCVTVINLHQLFCISRFLSFSREAVVNCSLLDSDGLSTYGLPDYLINAQILIFQIQYIYRCIQPAELSDMI